MLGSLRKASRIPHAEVAMLSTGTVVAGRYRLEERVAHGATSDLWRCVDEANGRTVAMNILAPILLEQPGFADQVRAQARAMASIDHPGIVVVYECVIGQTADPVAFLVTEFVEGESLARILARVGCLTPARTMSLVAQVAEALHAGHEKGFVHGRVKPADIMIRPDDTVVLTSFGVAPSVEAAGLVVGGGTYIAPEQAFGEPATHLVYIYTLGLVAYQCLAGRRPFEGESPLERAMRLVREQAPPLPPEVPANVSAIVERALARHPSDRWPSGASLAQAARVASYS